MGKYLDCLANKTIRFSAVQRNSQSLHYQDSYPFGLGIVERLCLQASVGTACVGIANPNPNEEPGWHCPI